jgi:hypothetical protein
VRASVSSFNIQYPLVSLHPSSGCLRLLPRLPVTYTLPSILPPMTCFRRQFLHKMWPIQLAYLLFVVYRTFFSSLTLCNTSTFLTRSVPLVFPFLLPRHIQNFPSISNLLSEVSKFRHPTKLCSKCGPPYFLPYFKPNLLVNGGARWRSG